MKISHSTFTNYIPYLGAALLFVVFLAWQQLVAIDERLFDIGLLISILLLLYSRTDSPAIGASVLLGWRLFDEFTYDTGIVNWIDFCVELPIITAIILYKTYKIRYTREEVKGLV